MVVFLVFLIGLTIWSAVSRSRDVWGFRPYTLLPVEIGLIALTVFFMRRDYVGFRDLKMLVDLPAQATGHMVVPGAKEMRAWGQILGVPLDTPLDTAGMASRPDYWIVETSLSPDSVIAFYRGAGRRDWVIEEEYAHTLVLARGNRRLRIFAGQPNWKPVTTVLYALQAR